MKKLLLSVACMAAFGFANAAEVTLDCNNATDFKGTFNEQVDKADGSGVQSYANYQPLESLKIGDYTFSFSVPADFSGTQPAYYYANTGRQYTIRMYTGNIMTVTAPEGEKMTAIKFNIGNGKATSTISANVGAAKYETASLISWGNTEGVESVTFTATDGNFRINTMVITTGENGEIPVDSNIFSSDFSETLNGFEAEDGALPEGITYVWACDTRYSCAKASAYVGGTNYAVESMLVSPVIDLTASKNCEVSFEHATNFFQTTENAKAEATVWVREENGEWEQLEGFTYPDKQSWTFIEAGAVSLAKFEGKKIQLGFKYEGKADHAGTWEVRAIAVTGESSTGLFETIVDLEAPAVYYNLQGVRVANPEKGIFVKVQGGKSTKVAL